MSKPVYLGKMLLHWCGECNVPVLGKKCGCGAVTKKIDITPPGDIRPAFDYDIEHINSIAAEQFNAPLIPPGHLVVLNKTPYDDRMEEVIMDGQVLGSVRFELDKMKWTLLPRLAAAQHLFKGKDLADMRGWVVMDSGAVQFILKGASLLAPGILDADPQIKKGDEVVVLNEEGEIIATGRARMSGVEMKELSKGVGVKTRWKGLPEPFKVPVQEKSWQDGVNANSEIMEKAVHKAHDFIKNVTATVDRPVSVSYSGGKDSLAVVQLVSECRDDFDILFADTGIEFPETIENVEQVAALYGKHPRIKNAGDAFWENIGQFGPPSVEARWCCKVCKLGPLSRVIDDNYENGCLTFIGQRKYESTTRARSDRIWKNPWVGNQIGASPIQDWTALHVWLYIFSRELPYNPMYEKGFDRIGCWLCPSSSLADLIQLKNTHPELADKLRSHLLEYAHQRGLSEQWVDLGLWRWQKLPPAIAAVAKEKGINTSPVSKMEQKLSFSITSGYRPCREGGMSAEGSFGRAIDLELIEQTGMLRACGKPAFIEGVAVVDSEDQHAQIFASGVVTARGKDEKMAHKFMDSIHRSVIKALKCTGCGVCVSRCPNNAIKMKNGIAMIGNNCNHCGACIPICPLVKFG